MTRSQKQNHTLPACGLALLLTGFGCRTPPSKDAHDHPPAAAADAGTRATKGCSKWGDPTPLGAFDPGLGLPEVSGLAASREDPDLLWVHNDSGDGARFYALARSGTLRAVFELAGEVAVDWEDMAAGPCPSNLAPTPGTPCLFLGDIGDNKARRSSVRLHVVREPSIDPHADPARPIPITPLASMTLTYEDGPHNAEALVVDPEGTPFLLTKGSHGTERAVYRLDAPITPGGSAVLHRLFTFLEDEPDPNNHLITAADLDPSGSYLLLRTYGSIAELTLPAGMKPESLAEATMHLLPAATEPQGEAIAWDRDAQAYLTASEGSGTIYRVACQAP